LFFECAVVSTGLFPAECRIDFVIKMWRFYGLPRQTTRMNEMNVYLSKKHESWEPL
jgi:hypothetical protein